MLAVLLSVGMVFSGSSISALASSTGDISDEGNLPVDQGESGSGEQEGESIELTVDNTEIEDLTTQTYTGKEITQEWAHVYYTESGDSSDTKKLEEGQDYFVEYENNIDAGDEAVIKITGMGKYEGTVIDYFTIEAKELSDSMIDKLADQSYTGSDLTPQLTVKDGDKTLTLDTDYTVSYANNREIGTATATITGIGNYKGTAKVSFNIISSIQNGVGDYNGRLAYFTNGKVDTSKNGLIQDPISKTWYYFANGYVNTGYTNLVQYNGGWYYVHNGKINWNETTLAQVNGKGIWYYVQKGTINWKYTGLVKYSDGKWYYIQGGKLDWSKTGYTGLTNYNGGWYFVSNNVLNWNASGLVKYNGGWFYVQKGVVNFKYTGLVNHYGGWYYVKTGQVDWTYTGLVYHYGGWYYVQKGVINWNYTSLAKYNGGWYGVEKGKINWNLTTLLEYNGKGYYVKNGKVDWTYNGKATLYGTNKTYTVKNGVAILATAADQMTQKAQSVASSTGYLILVDRSTHRVGVFTGSKNNWTNVGYWECVVGSSSTPTVAGQYTVGSKGKYFDTGSKARCWYYTTITGNYRFHSVIYDRSSTPKNVIDGTMDAAKSDGCVRLSLSCAKYIYDNVPKGSKIYIY